MTTGLATSQRETAKAGRRDRIVSAAYELLREVGVEETSVKLIADRAQVSRSTLFNLFPGKAAILAQVFDRDLRQFEALVAAEPSADALERLFDAIRVAARLYIADPGFYRAIMWRGRGGPDDESYAALSQPRQAFWRRMIETAEAEGLLVLEANAEAVSVLLATLFMGVLSDWISGVISAEQLRLEASYGFAVVLSAYATTSAGARLKAQLTGLQAQLQGARRRA